MRYALFTRLIESPNIVFYFKGIEDNESVSKALNTIVALDIKDALALEKVEAIKLCNELNKDKESLIEYGYTEFDITKITNSI